MSKIRDNKGVKKITEILGWAWVKSDGGGAKKLKRALRCAASYDILLLNTQIFFLA